MHGINLYNIHSVIKNESTNNFATSITLMCKLCSHETKELKCGFSYQP